MNYYFYNTDARSLRTLPRPRFSMLIEARSAISGGFRRFGEKLRQLEPGDTLLMYENLVGVVAVGEVLERWDGKTHKDLVYYRPGDECADEEGDDCEYRIKVNWLLADSPIDYQEIQRRFGTPRGTLRIIRSHRAEAERIAEGLRLSFTREAVDLAPPTPGRVATRTYRILRDTELARRVKALHNYECQICGHTIELPDGRRYAEAHHIHPLGEPHNGPDIMGNIVCVCPNHHAELDYGALSITLAGLRTCAGHSVEQEYADYHNQRVLYGGSEKLM